MKRYTVGLIIGVIVLSSFILHKSPIMTAQNPGPKPPTPPTKQTVSLNPLVITIDNKTNDDITVLGKYSSTIITSGMGGGQYNSAPKSAPKKNKTTLTFDVKKDFKGTSKVPLDRLEIEFLKAADKTPVSSSLIAPASSVHIIHSITSPRPQQNVTIK